jgi:hypothetical protein
LSPCPRPCSSSADQAEKRQANECGTGPGARAAATGAGRFATRFRAGVAQTIAVLVSLVAVGHVGAVVLTVHDAVLVVVGVGDAAAAGARRGLGGIGGTTVEVIGNAVAVGVDRGRRRRRQASPQRHRGTEKTERARVGAVERARVSRVS